MKTTCIMCPMGCALDINEVNGEVVVKGNTCKRGEIYGKQEFVNPMRSFTSLLFTKSGAVVSIKTSGLVPKNKINELAKYTTKVIANDNTKIGSVVENNVLGLNVDFVITGCLNR